MEKYVQKNGQRQVKIRIFNIRKSQKHTNTYTSLFSLNGMDWL